jgi:hypothetical protein
VKKRSGLYPWVGVDRTGSGVVSQAGGVTLVETVRVSGLDRELSAALAPRRKPAAVHDPAQGVVRFGDQPAVPQLSAARTLRTLTPACCRASGMLTARLPTRRKLYNTA